MQRAARIIKEWCKIEHEIELQELESDKINSYIIRLKKLKLPIRQIERLTSIGKWYKRFKMPTALLP